jgi:hypothetical protein
VQRAAEVKPKVRPTTAVPTMTLRHCPVGNHHAGDGQDHPDETLDSIHNGSLF